MRAISFYAYPRGLHCPINLGYVDFHANFIAPPSIEIQLFPCTLDVDFKKVSYRFGLVNRMERNHLALADDQKFVLK